MNLMEKFRITKTSLDKIKSSRNEYFYSMPEFQELFIELMVRKSEYYILQHEESDVGHAIINGDGILIEFHVKTIYVPQSRMLFELILKECRATQVYCKTFDSLLLGNCMLSALAYSVVGPLYRDHTEVGIEKDLSIQVVPAGLLSKDILLSQDDSLKELYETEDLLIEFLQNEKVFTFFKKDEMIGCGTIIRTLQNWDYCDLGVWINPKNRGNGFGTQILMNLRAFAIENNLKPSCGCAIENVASQKTIEKSGFASRYQLINFKTK